MEREEYLNYHRKYNREHKNKINKQSREWVRNNAKKVTENTIKWRKENPEKVKIQNHNNYIRNKEKYYARGIAQKNIKLGEKLCQRCNKRKAVERHHTDYNKPLEVELLCKKCHDEERVKL